jgi:ATP phosphoribosyltransferase regulatory subunit
LRFDLGLVHQIDYYTGVVFRGYAEGAGAPVLSGGRYDGLVELFGRPAEACGFAVDVDTVGSCLTAAVPKLELVVHYEDGCLAQALAVLDQRPAGSCELSPCRTVDSSVNLAREKGAEMVLVLEPGAERLVRV